MRLSIWFWIAVLAIGGSRFAGGAGYEVSSIAPPKPLREFRGVWVATVANIDWPSKPGLSTAAQKRELLEILDQASRLKLNAVILQVRPACDALYASTIEPWSEYLTGTMGRAPAPYYDPLSFAIAEAHKRGLELHAWLNPFRALHFSHWSRLAPGHISRTHPEIVRKYGQYLWLDPGEREAQEYSLRVVLDIVRRYDVDGIQFDDYFYPVEKDGEGRDIPFPDEASWQKFGRSTGMSRDDWRRSNVNQFVHRVYQSIKATKREVKFGISPFGIWRPGQPSPIRGTDAYASFYADSRKWLAAGWVDYLAPQLYWPIEPKEQSFPLLLNWWTGQNPRNRLLLAGISIANAGRWKPDEIPSQIRLAREQDGVGGYILYNTSSLLHDTSVVPRLEREINSGVALMPGVPWLNAAPPGKPMLTVDATAGSGARAQWEAAPNSPVRWWLLQCRGAEGWSSEILPGERTSRAFEGSAPEVVAVTAVSQSGQTGAAAVQKAVVATRPDPAKDPPPPAAQPGKVGAPRRSGRW